MNEITYRKASTIHSLLEYDFVKKGFKRDSKYPLDCDLLIIDEASMIDTRLMYALLRAIPSHARLILIGDIDQLPSVGAGNVLRDFISSNKITTSTLKYIFRQGKGSKISYNAYLINQGYFPKLKSEPEDDFFFIEEQEPELVLKKILNYALKHVPEKYHFDARREVQVLAPMRKGVIGVDQLNLQLQDKFKQNNAYFQQGYRRFYRHDKVMQLKNNHQKEIYNGDIGYIDDFDLENQIAYIKYDSKIIEYDFSDLDEVDLAYAVSIHKYQGSEAPCIIMPVHTQHFKLLCRNLLYTGITRGKKLVVLIGTKKALAIAIHNNEIDQRHTGLKEQILRLL